MPWPISRLVFADAIKLHRYRWANLPIDLNNAIQDELNLRGYGKISDVAMNATGGWVMHFREEDAVGRWLRGRKQSAQFRWGGELPDELKKALEQGRDRRAKIRV
jgi:hypothetical protein